MPSIRPFRALRYDDSRVAIERVVVPPPERANDDSRDALYAIDPRNLIRVLANRPEEGDDEKSSLVRAQTFLAQWRRAGVIIQDEDPALYVLRQRFMVGDVEKVRTGVFAALDLDRAAFSDVLPHEETLAGRHHEVTRVADTTGVQLEPISLLVDDDKGRMMRALSAELEEEPDVRFIVDDVTHEVWVVDDETTCARVGQLLSSTTLMIADGHHLFAAAKARAESSDVVSRLAVFLTPADDPGVFILPTHRVMQGAAPLDVDEFIAQLGDGFEVETLPSDISLDAIINLENPQLHFGIVTAQGNFRVTPAPAVVEQLLKEHAPDPEIAYPDTTVLDVGILSVAVALGGAERARVRYARETDYIAEAVARGEGRTVGLLVRAPSVAQVLATARAGHVLPPKSTAFRPRLTTGIAMLQTFRSGDEDL